MHIPTVPGGRVGHLDVSETHRQRSTTAFEATNRRDNKSKGVSIII